MKQKKELNHPEWDEKLFDYYESTGNFKKALAYMSANFILIPNKQTEFTSYKKREEKVKSEGLR